MKGPVLIDLDDGASGQPEPTPAAAPPVPDLVPRQASMQKAAALAAARPSPLTRWFWGLLGALLTLILSLTAWSALTALISSSPILGAIAAGLTAALALVCLAIITREAAALFRLGRLDRIQSDAGAALSSRDLGQARVVLDDLERLYAARPDLGWGRERLAERRADPLDADALLSLAETTLLEPLDQRARREVEAAARQVATVTAVVPLAFADVIAALTSNIRMIRRIAEIYGGRSGALGGWRLTRAVLSHLVATGAVAVGDDLIGSVAGGGVLSRVSRRFGEGVINGALTARVGVAAIEVCRPLPFIEARKPSVTRLVQRALTGLFGGSKDAADM
ncbi:YcjF family protein [Aestuariibius insulae]|uniref:YcjF family protein n=1 Tax=Aestuariibius insulae TaxID=2058287 RepID=UPI00345E3DBA